MEEVLSDFNDRHFSEELLRLFPQVLNGVSLRGAGRMTRLHYSRIFDMSHGNIAPPPETRQLADAMGYPRVPLLLASRHEATPADYLWDAMHYAEGSDSDRFELLGALRSLGGKMVVEPSLANALAESIASSGATYAWEAEGDAFMPIAADGERIAFRETSHASPGDWVVCLKDGVPRFAKWEPGMKCKIIGVATGALISAKDVEAMRTAGAAGR
jgi:hypothetical protein